MIALSVHSFQFWSMGFGIVLSRTSSEWSSMNSNNKNQQQRVSTCRCVCLVTGVGQNHLWWLRSLHDSASHLWRMLIHCFKLRCSEQDGKEQGKGGILGGSTAAAGQWCPTPTSSWGRAEGKEEKRDGSTYWNEDLLKNHLCGNITGQSKGFTMSFKINGGIQSSLQQIMIYSNSLL